MTLEVMSFQGFLCVAGDDITTSQSFEFDLTTIEAATNNFSSHNKIGDGGFGGVYKVRKVVLESS